MAKRTNKTADVPASERRRLLAGIDPIALSELLENHSDSGPGLPYRRVYMDVLTALLERDGEETVSMAKLLDAVDAATMVEASMRQAGFVVGFECCRQLLLGELDLAALKGGAK